MWKILSFVVWRVSEILSMAQILSMAHMVQFLNGLASVYIYRYRIYINLWNANTNLLYFPPYSLIYFITCSWKLPDYFHQFLLGTLDFFDSLWVDCCCCFFCFVLVWFLCSCLIFFLFWLLHFNRIYQTGKVWPLQVTLIWQMLQFKVVYFYFCIYHAYSIFIPVKIHVKYFGACWQYHSYEAGIRRKVLYLFVSRISIRRKVRYLSFI